jgi:hypothetical protein
VRTPTRLALLLAALVSIACASVRDVRVDQLQPRYASPTAPARSTTPLVLLYDTRDLLDDLPLETSQLPTATLRGARSLVTSHLRAGMEIFFERVTVESDPTRIPPGAVVGAVRIVRLGLNEILNTNSAGGGLLRSVVGTLEWSISLRRPGSAKPFYSLARETVGTREAFPVFTVLDPSPAVLGAIEAALRALVGDLEAKGVVALVDSP